MTGTRHAADMPAMGFGTYGRRDREGQAAIEAAIDIGYRLLDTAQDYDTEKQCRAAWQASGLGRDAFFLTTKVATGNLGAGRVLPSVEQSLENLGVDQVDLVLIHWPSPNEEVPLPVYMEQIAEVQQKGLARHIGVSNFTIALIEHSRKILGDVPIFTNQVEVHPYLQNRKLVDYCLGAGVSITCYQPLAKGTVADDQVLAEIGAAYDAGPDQVALAFLIQQGLAVIPTSGKPERMARNFAAQELTLSDADMARVRTLDRGGRRIAPAWGPDWD